VPITAQCPKCQGVLHVQVGRKSTCRQTRCGGCGARYDYSAWLIKKTSDKTFHQVDLFEVTR
jgi:DNA-directed RNA polymerase subunit M/transcription elongation factor TFIIS